MKQKQKQKKKTVELEKFKTPISITWCPGCLNNNTLLALRQALIELVKEKKIQAQNIVLVTDIGCGAKTYDFLSTNAFYSLHGRVLPTALGIKAANSKLTVIGIGGDGGTYSEGVAHLIHACRFNPDITMIVANNGVFALTKGQATPTTRGWAKKKEESFFTGENLNPLTLTLSSGASLVARGSALDLNHLSGLFKTAIQHKGFSFIDVLQPCLIFHNDVKHLRQYGYQIKNPLNFKEAFYKAQEGAGKEKKQRVPLGIFYKSKKKIFGEKKTTKNKKN